MATEENEMTGLLDGAQQSKDQRVTVTDIDISFANMVGLLVKLAFAAIPAAIIVVVVAYAAAMIARGIARG